MVIGCSKDADEVVGQGSVAGQAISLNATIQNGADTRVVYQDNVEDQTIHVEWSDNDAFNLYRGSSTTPSLFSKTTAGGTFTGTIPNGDGNTYYAVYPAEGLTVSEDGISVDISKQVGTATDKGIYDFMVAKVNEALKEGTQIVFQHQLAILKLNLTFPEGTTGTVKCVTVSGINNQATYNISSSEYAFADAAEKGMITATNGTTGFEIQGGKITAYISVFPEKVERNQVEIVANDGTNDYTFKMPTGYDFSRKKGTVVPVNITLEKVVRNFKPEYIADDYKTWSTENCGSAPTKDQMKMYLGAGVYWDDGDEGNNQQTYTVNGSVYHTGLWVMKKAYINGFSAGSAKKVDDTDYDSSCWHTDRPTDINKYFFLPAAGFYYLGSSFEDPGSYGSYWSSSPSGDANAYYLGFTNSGAIVYCDARGSGCLSMAAE